MAFYAITLIIDHCRFTCLPSSPHSSKLIQASWNLTCHSIAPKHPWYLISLEIAKSCQVPILLIAVSHPSQGNDAEKTKEIPKLDGSMGSSSNYCWAIFSNHLKWLPKGMLYRYTHSFYIIKPRHYIKLPVVPHKAVAEVSKIGNL